MWTNRYECSVSVIPPFAPTTTVIVPKQGVQVTEKEIIEFCGKNLAGFKKPKSVEFWKELPKSPQGKILKKEIRKHYGP